MRILFIICAILLSIPAVSQKKIYTQKDLDSFSLRNPTPEKLSQFKYMLESSDDLVLWMSYYKQKCYFHLIQEEHDSVLLYGQKGLQYLKNKKLSKEKYEVEEPFLKAMYLYMAIVLTSEKKQYHKSTEYLLKAKALIKKYPHFRTTNHPFIYRYLMKNFLEMGDKREALRYSIVISKDTSYMKNPKNAASTYNYLGVLYKELGDIDSSLYWYKKHLKRKEKIKDFALLRVTYNNIGDLYRYKNIEDSAIFYYKKSKKLLDQYPKQNYGISKYYTQSNFGYVLLQEGKTKTAIKILKRVLDSVQDIKENYSDLKILKATTIDYLSEAYQQNNELNKAIDILKYKNEFLEKFHQDELEEKLRELSIAYEVKEKDDSIQKLEATTEAQNTIIKQRNLISLILGVLLLALLSVGFLIFRQGKLKSKYETASLEQRLLRSQLNPHFVFNALNTVSSLANKKSEKTVAYISKLSSLIRLILKNSREEFVSLEDELKSIEDYLELQSNFSQKFKYQIVLDDKIDKEETCIPPMFIQPFIENSIEHGLRNKDQGTIKVSIELDKIEKLLKCSIVDNGIGLEKKLDSKNNNVMLYESLSGKILEERLHIYAKTLHKKARYTISDVKNEKGVRVNVFLPFIADSYPSSL